MQAISASTTPRFSYDPQILALTRGATAEANGDTAGVLAELDAFCTAARVGDDIHCSMQQAILTGGKIIKTVWAETGGCLQSLFAFLPGCQHCLTQAKSVFGLGAESDWFAEQLNLVDNAQIPTSPDHIAIHMLPEFARLQQRAREIACA